MKRLQRPFYPIIYLRGYAMTQSEIDATTATPYMGFNLGSTKIRQAWDGRVVRHIFESPLIRLMKEYGYQDVYRYGQEITGTLPARSIFIYRYYEQADRDFGAGDAPSIIEAAQGLHDLILRIRQQICNDDAQLLQDFKVYLVAHSMGGLICRAFIQNPQIGTKESKALVDKVFTYATPHNGIDMAGFNVPTFLGIWDLNNFNRQTMAKYLALPSDGTRVDSLNGYFDPDHFFCLIGTNAKDYSAAAGIARKLVGELSDGLVRIENSAVHSSPRAFVHRSHSGTYGIVNSEEGYQNLIRFLFGDVRVDGTILAEELPLPPAVSKARQDGKTIKASYYFEAVVSPRGAYTFSLTERRKETHSAVLRRFDELFPKSAAGSISKPRSPVLFSVFLDTKKITVSRKNTLVFSVELAVSTTDYEIDGFLFFDQHVPGEYLFRNTVIVRATKEKNAWELRYVFADDNWSENKGELVEQDENGPYVPLTSAKGFRGRLHLSISYRE